MDRLGLGSFAEAFHRQRHAAGDGSDDLLRHLEGGLGDLAGLGHDLLHRVAGEVGLQLNRLLEVSFSWGK